MPSTSCFVHVPKTGGSWVTDALRRALPTGALYEVPSAEVGHVPAALLLQRYTAITGHFTMAQLRDVVGTTFLFTFLRDPVDRVLSLYYFYREQEAAGVLDPRVAHAKALELAPFVAQLRDRVSPWSNWQTYVFSGAAHCEQPAEELLPLAIDNLDRIDFVGVQDALVDGVAELSRLRGWDLAPTTGRVNATKHRASMDRLPEAAIARLQELNACDRELFRVAQQRWRSQHGRSGGISAASRSAAAPPAGRREMGTREVVITAADVLLEQQRVTIHVRAGIAVDDLTVGIRITDEQGAEVYGTNTRLLGQAVRVAPGEQMAVDFRLDMALAPGAYFLTTAAHRGADHLEGCFHWIDNAVQFVSPSPRML